MQLSTPGEAGSIRGSLNRFFTMTADRIAADVAFVLPAIRGSRAMVET
jgi:hypothetical protein